MRGLLVALFFVALGAQAQEYEARSEFTFCKLNEGKNLMDVMAQSERYGEFSKEAGTEYLQVVLTPMHAGVNNPYDYVIWGQWPSGQAMYNEWGSFTNDYWKWMSEQEESMEPAGTCSGTVAMFNSATAHSRIPWDDRDDWQPHQLADCTLKQGATLEQVMEAQARTGELMKEAGFEG